MRPSFSCIALMLVATAIAGGCFRGDCGGDSCPNRAFVAGRVTSPDGAPVADLRLESQSAFFTPGTGCDTTTMRSFYEVRTGPTGSYVLAFVDGTVDEVNCAFVRLPVMGNPGLQWNDTLVGPLQLHPFTTEEVEDTARTDIILQPAVAVSAP